MGGGRPRHSGGVIESLAGLCAWTMQPSWLTLQAIKDDLLLVRSCPRPPPCCCADAARAVDR